jgi:centrin-3
VWRRAAPLTASVGTGRDTFALCDEDESGTVDARELSVACEALGIAMSAEERERAVKQAAKGGALDFKAFVELMAPKLLARDPQVELREAFALFDADSKGFVTEADLLRVAQELDDAHPSATASMMWNEFVAKGAPPRLAFEQFVAIVTSPAAVSAANARASLTAPPTTPPSEPRAKRTSARR